MAQHGGKYPVGVGWVNGESADLKAIAEAGINPGFTAIRGAVNAISDAEVGSLEPSPLAT